ncbi:hypothetical protein KY284_007679 [Solanum tuberosum]|nr:hypothetical protein KY284_007679 [Solanum tuberosum]
MVQEAWDEDVGGSSMRRLYIKMKNVSRKLSLWSREHIGNICDKVREWEAKTLDLETDYIENDNDDLRPQIHKTQAEHTRWLKCKQSILRQKANIIWLKDGDFNTKYLHVVISEKRRRATIHRIQLENGQWITGDDQIAKEAVDYFSKLFSNDQEIELRHLDCIDQRVHRDDNNMLEAIPNEAEIKEVVFGLNLDSTLGADGFGGAFYQSCWDIIKSDLIDVIQQYFGGTGKQKIAFYSDMVSELVKRTTGWHGRLLSVGGRATLIRHNLEFGRLISYDFLNSLLNTSRPLPLVIKT